MTIVFLLYSQGQLDLSHQDPADRFIVATAVHHNFILATVDSRLIGFNWPTLQ